MRCEVSDWQEQNNDLISTKFLSINDYHHHIALNEWTPAANCSAIKNTDLGVDHITFEMPTIDSLIELKEQLETKQVEYYFNKGKKIIGLSDPNGIQLWFIVLKH